MIRNSSSTRLNTRLPLILLALAALSASMPSVSASAEETLVLDVTGMTSPHCERYVEEDPLAGLPGLIQAEADHEANQVTIQFDPSLITPEELAGFLATHRAEAVPASTLASRLSFTPNIPHQLPGGFRLAESYLIRDTCCAGSCTIYRRGKEVVGLVQQPPSHPLPWAAGRVIQQVLSGVSCRRTHRDAVDVVQIDPHGRNLTLVSIKNEARTEAMVSYLTQQTP